MRVIGHRGAPIRAPENTLESFRAAIEDGADAVECDARMTADGAVVIAHDDDVARTTGAQGRISQMTLAEVRALRVGGRGPVPDLGDVLALAAPLVIEVKGAVVDGVYLSAVPTARIVASAVADRTDVIISSFEPDAIGEAKAIAPLVRTGLGVLPGAPLDWSIHAARDGGHIACHVPDESLSQRFLEDAHSFGIDVLVFTVNDPARACELHVMGVDGVFSDDPAGICAALREYG